jgi:hypothetical protein
METSKEKTLTKKVNLRITRTHLPKPLQLKKKNRMKRRMNTRDASKKLKQKDKRNADKITLSLSSLRSS